MTKRAKTRLDTRQVVIQKRIDEVMHKEFDKIIVESSKDPLLRLIRENKTDSMSLAEIRRYLREKSK
mgnify:CR=1 FL=1